MPEQTWGALLDVPRVARALPGASIEEGGAGGVYRGSMTVKLGPVTTEYRGVAELLEVDDDTRVATFLVKGREERGHGTASATIRNRVTPADGGTRVTVETDLEVTGRAGQLGRGLMEDVAAKLLDEFAARLGSQVLAPGPERGAPASQPAEALELGRAARGALLARRAARGATTALGAVIGFLLGRRQR